MKSMRFMILTLLVTCGFASCESDDNDETTFDIQKVQVVNIDAPSSALIGEEIKIEVVFIVYNGCGQFGKFIENVNGRTRTISVEAKYIGEICTTDIPRRTVDYTFTPQVAGDYTFRFLTFDGEYITAKITVR